MTENTDKRKEAISACHQNARDLIYAAQCILQGNGRPSAAYHLALLAIEETGKAALLKIEGINLQVGQEISPIDKKLDNHYKKLLWAFWLPGFSGGKISKKQFEEAQLLAQRMHTKRLASLYVSHVDDDILLDIPKDEAESTIKLAEARLNIEELFVADQLDKGKIEDYNWFIAAAEDEEKKKFIFSQASMKKLEEDETMYVWVQWLRTEFGNQENAMRALVQKELDKQRPEGDEAQKDKWKIKLKWICTSHSIRQKELNFWNDQVNWIKLHQGDKKKKELFVEFTFPQAVPAKVIWHAGYGFTRRVLLALNIGSMGFFWWYSLNRENKFYDEIIDLEHTDPKQTTGMVIVEQNPYLYINWGQRTLQKEDLQRALMCFSCLPGPDASLEQQNPFGQYLTGLAFLAKTDLHLNLTPNASGCFFNALKSGMQLYGDIKPDESFADAFVKNVAWIITDEVEQKSFINLADKLGSAKNKDFIDLTLDKVLQTKTLCDAYFLKKFQEIVSKPSPTSID